MAERNKMSKSPKGIVIYRISRVLIFLSKPRTVTEICQELGIGSSCAGTYLTMMQKAGYPLRATERVIPGKGQNPLEHFIHYEDPIIQEAIRLILELRGM